MLRLLPQVRTCCLKIEPYRRGNVASNRSITERTAVWVIERFEHMAQQSHETRESRATCHERSKATRLLSPVSCDERRFQHPLIGCPGGVIGLTYLVAHSFLT
jgi:hypothetical protein